MEKSAHFVFTLKLDHHAFYHIRQNDVCRLQYEN